MDKPNVEGIVTLLRPLHYILLSASLLLLAPPQQAAADTMADYRKLRTFDFIDDAQFHGFILDEEYKLIVEQKNDTAVIRLHKWERPPGGPFLWYNHETGEDASIIRFEEETDLLRIRSEVLVPAPPNYLKNPGLRYRVTINGIAIAPEYHKVFEVNAGDALSAIFSEIDKVYNNTHGIYRTAVYYGAVIALRVLNQAAHLPAELPLGTIKSRSAQARIEGEYLTRREQPRLDRFPTTTGTKEFARVLGSELTAPMKPGRPADYHTSPTPTAMSSTPVRTGSFRLEHATRSEQEDHRSRQLDSINDQKAREKVMGRPGRSLTIPEHDYPAISASQIESLDLLLGETKSPMELRSESQAPQRPVPGVQRPLTGR